jgi:tetratricopeptide (TPR) repeat protein
MNWKRITHIIILAIFLNCLKYGLIYGQNQDDLDSLQQVLKTSEESAKPLILIEIANLYYADERTNEALRTATEAISLAKENNNKEQLAIINNSIGMMHVRQGNYENAVSYYKKAIRNAQNVEVSNILLNAYDQLSICYYYLGDIAKMKEFSQKTLDLSKKINDKEKEASSLQKLGMYFYQKGEFDKTLDYWKKQLDILKEYGSKTDLALAYNNIGVIYKKWGDYEKAIENFQMNLKIQEELGDTVNMARSLNNIGNVYYNFGIDYNKALHYYKQGLDLFKSIKDSNNIAKGHNNIGLIYDEKQNYEKALNSFSKALEISQNTEEKYNIAKSEINLGSVYMKKGNFEKAISYSYKAIEIFEKMEDKNELAKAYGQLGEIYFKIREFRKALKYYHQTKELMREMKLKKELSMIYRDMSDVYEKIGKSNKALDYYKKYSELKDSTLTDKYLEIIEDINTKYETERKEQEIKLLNEKSKRQEAENKRQRVLIFAAMGGFLIILIFSLLLFKQFNEKRKANILLAEQNEEISQQRDQILKQKQEITDSIQYASRIQKAILPPEDSISGILNDYFIYFRPRDIVSGDFYWLNRKADKVFFTAADCTGHGVPGAFMSMLGTAFLNEIVNKYDDITAAQILDELKRYVVESLHQTGKTGETQDGMDIALCILDYKRNILQFAGAYNPLLLIRNGELTEYKGDKMPIGIYHQKNEHFANTEIEVQNGDSLYIFSDGYVDQFGGGNGKKFMKKRFKELLVDIQKHSMKEQYRILDETLKDWMSGAQQIDDILVMGVRVGDKNA